LSNPTVLLAEDDSDTRELIRHLLESNNFTVIGAEDAILAYGVVSTAVPDIIVADIMMPKVDGVGLIRWIRTIPECDQTPIIAMTAYADSFLKHAEEAGATATIRKPEEISDLPDLINRLLSKYKVSGDGKAAASY